jgi:hypothetical protein
VLQGGAAVCLQQIQDLIVGTVHQPTTTAPFLMTVLARLLPMR